MCHLISIKFGQENLKEITGKRVIEIGSQDINGGLREHIESQNPAEYIGTDVRQGKGVDVVCRAEDVLDKFGKESFDVVVSTETIEHIKDWKKAVSNIKNICKPNGIILITTRSIGFPYHPDPKNYCKDYWRYEARDMKHIFSDCIIEKLEKDSSTRAGIFIKARKPLDFIEKDLSDYKLFRITRFNDYLRRLFETLNKR